MTRVVSRWGSSAGPPRDQDRPDIMKLAEDVQVLPPRTARLKPRGKG